MNNLDAHKKLDPAKLPKNWSHPWRARSLVWLRSQTGNYLQFQGRWGTISCPQYKYSLHLLDCWGTGLPVSFQQRDWIYSNSTSMYKKGKAELLRSNEASGWLDCRPTRWSLYWSLDINQCTMYYSRLVRPDLAWSSRRLQVVVSLFTSSHGQLKKDHQLDNLSISTHFRHLTVSKPHRIFYLLLDRKMNTSMHLGQPFGFNQFPIYL